MQAYREELIELYYLGCRHLQFDDPTFAFFCADSTIDGMDKAGVDSEKLFDRYIQVYNAILANRPSDFTMISSRSCTRSMVVKRCPHPPQNRRRRMADPSSVGRLSFTCVSSWPQNGHRIRGCQGVA